MTTHHLDEPHTHPHPHPDPSSAAHAHPALPAPSHQGSVVLDIGAGTGALVIHTTDAEDGLEIHVSPESAPRQRTHAAVRPRRLPDRTLYAAVITPLPVGRYTVWDLDDTAHGTTVVAEGQVSDYRWASEAEPADARTSRAQTSRSR